MPSEDTTGGTDDKKVGTGQISNGRPERDTSQIEDGERISVGDATQ
jgi:hypothetical protein